MKFGMTKIAGGIALLAFVSGAHAVTTHTVTNLSIIEISTDSTLASADASVQATGGGIFFFGAEPGNGLRPAGAPIFTSTGAAGIIANGVGQANNTITPGFNFGGNPFDINTLPLAGTPGITASISDNNTLVIDLSAWGGNWAGSGGVFRHVLFPDAGTLVTSLENVGGTWYYTADWAHTITADEDFNPFLVPPDFNGFAGQRGDFHLEGTLIAVAVPEASTYGMMLAGLGLVGGMVARRRKLMA